MPMRDRLARLVHRNPDRPSLRERAAALKASAARVLRKDAAARIGWDPAAPIDGADADLLRLARVWLELHAREQASLERQERIERRCPVPDVPAVGSPGWEGWHAQATAWRSASRVDEEEAEGRRLAREADRLASKIAAMPARTLAGLQAKARIVQSFADMDGDPIEGLVPGLARDLMALTDETGGARIDWTDAPPAPVASDAELFALGRQFDEAHAAWMALVPAGAAAQMRVDAFRKRAEAEGMETTAAHKAAWLQDGVNEAYEAEQAAFDALEPLNRAIMGLPAHTIDGLAVKARSAIPTVWATGSFDADRSLGEHEHWERRGVRDLIEACVALAEQQAAGSDRDPAGQIATDALRLFDFSGMSAFEVMTLHNHARTIRRVAHGLLAMPCSRRDASERPGLNAAGALPDLLAALTDSIMDACIARAGEPSDDLDAEEERLSVLAEHVICNGDPEPIRALARDLNAYADRV